MKYTFTDIAKHWKISKPKLQRLLNENNVTPIDERPVEIHSMVYFQRFTVTAKYYDPEVINDLMKFFPLRT